MIIASCLLAVKICVALVRALKPNELHHMNTTTVGQIFSSNCFCKCGRVMGKIQLRNMPSSVAVRHKKVLPGFYNLVAK